MLMALEDRLSSLSDDILRHILSFNPTKDAVITGVLSKRWIHLWCSIPFLDFTNIKLGNIESILHFNQLVSSVFVSRDIAGSRSINSFYLDIEYANRSHACFHSFSNLTTWVDLFLNVLNGPTGADAPLNPRLLHTIFSCKTLEVLKLSWFNVQGFSVSSVQFGFPSLKTLHLKHINFDNYGDMLMLLAGCPILEDFKAFNLFVYNDVWEESFCQVIQRLNLSKLIRADIITDSCYFPTEALFNLEFLKIQLMEMYTPYDFATYDNLTHLVINNIWDSVLQALHHCPKLQNLELYQTHSWWDEHIEGQEQESWVDPKFPPQCLQLSLRTCTIWDFTFSDVQHNIMLRNDICTTKF